MVDGIDSSADTEAIVTNDRISNIRVTQDQDHAENNFGEAESASRVSIYRLVFLVVGNARSSLP